MRQSRKLRRYAGAGGALAVVLLAGAVPAGAHGSGERDRARHVLLLSVDGRSRSTTTACCCG
ncbi:MAG TPA: hypothetical protein VEO01_19225 [Pseudonocardiaceae bacterium]|nr:hypothetical protein [Pseudonocardiaceae bacterium]